MLIIKQAIELENTEILYLIASLGTEHFAMLAFKRIGYNLQGLWVDSRDSTLVG
jgi:hypothetical protein